LLKTIFKVTVFVTPFAEAVKVISALLGTKDGSPMMMPPQSAEPSENI
jgi:hypothetical protein